MPYQNGDDPNLAKDLHAALRHWHRPTLGDEALAEGLKDVERRLSADPWLTRAEALQRTVRVALSSLRDGGQSEQAELLERHYLRDESVALLTDAYHLSERTIYYRLEAARVALAHALWAQERPQTEAAIAIDPVPEPSLTRHLPPQTFAELLGRDQALDQLLGYLDDRTHHWVICLEGMAGIGKSALARQAVGCLAKTDRFSGIAWVTVRPVSYSSHGPQWSDLPTLTCGQVLDTIASQLGNIDLGQYPLPDKRQHVRRLLQERPYLIVLDNLEAVMECGTLPAWFWDMADPSKFLLTSRHWVEAETGLSILALDELSVPDSLDLIRREALPRDLPEVAGANQDALQAILAVTGGNPLAIKLVLGQLVSLPLGQILTALKTAQASTESFYQYLYRTSWDLISSSAQTLLLHMARLPERDTTWEELSAISGFSAAHMSSAIEELTAHSLLQASGFEEKVYSIHPLTQHFVMSQATTSPSSPPRHSPGTF